MTDNSFQDDGAPPPPNPQTTIAALLRYQMGDHVLKVGEDSTFEGYVVSAFIKRNGRTVRYVVENDDGVLHIASEKQLKWIAPERPPVRRHPDILSDRL